MAPVAENEKSVAEAEKRKINLELGRFLSTPAPGEEIVISGLSGAYPESSNVYEFQEKLFAKENMVLPTKRWNIRHAELPDRTGTLPELGKFDAGFFGIHERQTHSYDPLGRLVAEKAIEAIIDAGINPTDLEGTNTGVYVGVCFSEDENAWFFERTKSDSFSVTGVTRSMLPHRISLYLKLKGPSVTVDTACSSSLFAIENAFRDLRTGKVDVALVTGVNVCAHPMVSLQFARLGVLSKDGCCKSFDKAGNGYARSECACVVVLQRAKDALRSYGTVVYAKTNSDGYKEQGITYPSGMAQMELVNEFYEDCEVDKYKLSFLEAHGTGTSVGDPEECGAMDLALAKDRQKPLLIGSVKSNIGHSEPGSGLCSITKAIISMETGFIPPNIHFYTPRPEIKAICEGRMKVVTEKTPFEYNTGLIAVNSFGFGGANCHVLLSTHKKVKVNHGLPTDNIPRLVCISGRTREAVKVFLDDLKNNKLDAERVALIHSAFRKKIRNHPFRGYTIVSKAGEICRHTDRSRIKRPQLFVALGELIDWTDVGKKLLAIPTFSDSLQRTQKYLLQKGINIVDILNNSETKDAYSIVGNIAVQLGIADILRHLEIEPKKYYGYSYSELLAAHLNGNISLNDMFSCIIAVNEAMCKTRGATKAVNGLSNGYNGYQNGHDGQNKYVKAGDRCVAEQLKQTLMSNQQASIKLLQDLRSILPASKGREYSPEHYLNALTTGVHLNNLTELDTVLLNVGYVPPVEVEQTLAYEPQDNEDAVIELLNIIGRLYTYGYYPQIQRLYPSVQFPVSRGTRMISPFVQWQHNRTWFFPEYKPEEEARQGHQFIPIVITDEKWRYIQGHVVGGRNLFPASGYLYLVWELLSDIKEVTIENMTVIFEDCRFLRATSIPPKGHISMSVTIQPGTGNFEVMEGAVVIVTGRIRHLVDYEKKYEDSDFVADDGHLNTKDIYKELRLRGYNYSGAFRALLDYEDDTARCHVKWENNWVTLLDNMLQTKILQSDTRLLYVPTYIREVVIPAKVHLDWIKNNYIDQGKEPNLPIYNDPNTNTIRCGDVTIKELLATSIHKRKDPGVPVLEKHVFVPNVTNLELEQSVRVNMQLLLENTLMLKIKAVEVVDSYTEENSTLVTPIAHTVLGDQPLIQPLMKILSKTQLEDNGSISVEDKSLSTEKDCTLVIVSKVFTRNNPQDLQSIYQSLSKGGFILSREPPNFDASKISDPGIAIHTVHRTSNETMVFLKRLTEKKPVSLINVGDTENFLWISELQQTLKLKPHNDIVVYAEHEQANGILGFVNCIRREPESQNVKCVFLMDTDRAFDLNDNLIATQLHRDMAVSVLKGGVWGTYRHLLLSNIDDIENEHFFANVTVRGDLSSIKWLEGPLTSGMKPPSEESLVYVCYATLNFRDVMTATGKINADVITHNRLEQECVQGFEFSGIDEHGNKIMGMTKSGALATMFFNDNYLNVKVPDRWSLEEAATIPVVYSTVIYALKIRAKMRRNESVLIHSGTGGIGQAAIIIALYEGCTVFTTVGTQEKREYLMKTFPQLKAHHIGNSHDTSFEQLVLRETSGRGVDIVLNSLAEDKLITGIRCLANGGRFLEIGKFDLANNSDLRLELMRKGCSFHGVMLDRVFDATPEEKKEMVKYLEDALQSGSVKPLNRTVFKYNEVEQAFRYMTTGKHMGKVLIQVRNAEDIKQLPPAKKFKGFPRYFCYPDKSYIIIGGLGGFGLELADWLILRGARKLVLTSRKGIQTGYQRLRVKTWRSYGAAVHITQADVATRVGCIKLIEESSRLGPVHAVFNLAAVLADAIFENQTPESFLTSFTPKAKATEHLDEVTRKMCPDLRDFVVFSSVSCGRGNPGQTNYGMANSVMERICERRRRDGYPALAVQWGAIGEVGLVAQMQDENIEIEIGGTLQQTISSCLNVLNLFLRQKEAAIVSSMVVAEKRGASSVDNVVDAVLCIIGISDIKQVSHHSTLAELGMDSMSAVEIKQTLERDFEVFLSPKDIRGLTLAKLKELQLKRLSGCDDGSGKGPDETGTGTQLILRVIGDESQSKLKQIPLQSRISDSSSKTDVPTVFVIPGIEGFAKVMSNIAAGMDGRAVGLQFEYGVQADTLQDIAASLLPVIKKELPSKDEPIRIIAYSYGTCVALEIVHALEKEGYTPGTIVLIDGSPDTMRALVTQDFGTAKEDFIQTVVFCRMIEFHMTPDIVAKSFDQILACEGLEQRIIKTIELANEFKPLDNPEYYRLVCKAIYNRVMAMLAYTPSYTKIKSKLYLIKPTQATVKGVADDMGLTELSEQPLDMYTFQGNHINIVDSQEVVEKVNSILFDNKQ